jgi:hypothetical protein
MQRVECTERRQAGLSRAKSCLEFGAIHSVAHYLAIFRFEFGVAYATGECRTNVGWAQPRLKFGAFDASTMDQTEHS